MKYIKIIIALSVITITTFFACSSPSTERGQVAEPPAAQVPLPQIPTFKIQDPTGKVFDLKSLKGKKVFVNLWAAWCPPCRAEMPSIAALFAKANKSEVVFIMLSLDENFKTSLDYIEDNNIVLPVYFPSQGLPSIFETGGIPVTFIFNETGELIKKVNGSDDYDTAEYLRLLGS